MRGIYTALMQGDRAAASMLERADMAFDTSRELENYRTQVLFVPAKITGVTPLSGGVKYRYDWEEVRLTFSTNNIATKVGGLNSVQQGVAFNWNELANTAGFWAPLGDPASVPLGFQLEFIAIGTPVLLFPIRDTTGKLVWCFDKVNAIDGNCPNPLTEPPGEPE